MLVIQKVIESLNVNKKTVLDGVLNVLKAVFSTSKNSPEDTDGIKKKIENLTSKTERLLDLYLSEDITKEEYRTKKENYEKEISQLNKKMKTIQKETHYMYDRNNAITEIREYLSDILYAKKQDETFYKNIIDKIVVFDREHLDVYLNLLPHRWKTVLNSALGADDLRGSNKPEAIPNFV